MEHHEKPSRHYESDRAFNASGPMRYWEAVAWAVVGTGITIAVITAVIIVISLNAVLIVIGYVTLVAFVALLIWWFGNWCR
jgi:hypothetical protein